MCKIEYRNVVCKMIKNADFYTTHFFSQNIFFTHDSYDNVDIYYHWVFYISANEITMFLVTI